MYQPSFRKKKNLAPVLSLNEINEIAECFVLDFCPDAATNPQPLNIDLFLEAYLGLSIDYHYLSNCGLYLGMTVFKDTDRVVIYLPENDKADYISIPSKTVIIDSSLTETNQINRYRYTGGHEAGHWIFHKDHYDYISTKRNIEDADTHFIQCKELRKADMSTDTKTWSDQKWMEWQADKYSSCWFMPESAVKIVFNKKLSWKNEEPELLRIIANTFQVSELAACYRLLDLGYITPHTGKVLLSMIG